MSYQVDLIIKHGNDELIYIDGEMRAERPGRLGTIDTFSSRLGDAWKVLTGEYDAIRWYKQ